jgi:prevent-host-death family protein
MPRIPKPGHWHLQDAKARFSELITRVHSEGPQHVTVHGRDEVVVISAHQFRRLNGGPISRDPHMLHQPQETIASRHLAARQSSAARAVPRPWIASSLGSWR